MASRMTKYLKQTATLLPMRMDTDGNVELNNYGEPVYGTQRTVRCRKEPYRVTQRTQTGQIVDVSTIYYFDDSVKPKVGDKLDGSIIQNVSEYWDGSGSLVGYEVHV